MYAAREIVMRAMLLKWDEIEDEGDDLLREGGSIGESRIMDAPESKSHAA